MIEHPASTTSPAQRWVRFALVALTFVILERIVAFVGWGDAPLSHLFSAVCGGVAVAWYVAFRLGASRR